MICCHNVLPSWFCSNFTATPDLVWIQLQTFSWLHAGLFILKIRRNKNKKHISAARAIRCYVISLIHLLIPNSMFSVYSKTKTTLDLYVPISPSRFVLQCVTFSFTMLTLNELNCILWSKIIRSQTSYDLSYVNIAHNRAVMISDRTQLLCFMLNFV